MAWEIAWELAHEIGQEFAWEMAWKITPEIYYGKGWRRKTDLSRQ